MFAAIAVAGALGDTQPPPVYTIHAATLEDAGRQHGVLARERIEQWFASAEMGKIFSWVEEESERPSSAVPWVTIKTIHWEGTGAEHIHDIRI